MKHEKLIQKIDSFIPKNTRPYVLGEPDLGQVEKEYVDQCVSSGWISYYGEFVKKFEDALAHFYGVKHVITMVNGTAALHMACHSLGINKDHEVLAPSLTFVATTNAIHYTGASPHFVEADSNNFGIDLDKLSAYLEKIVEKTSDGYSRNKITKRIIKAIVPVHLFGFSVDIEKLMNIAQKYNLFIIEDAAESMGSTYKNKHLGTFGDVAATSFNGNKIITTGGGGALFTNNDSLAEKIRHLSTTAKNPHKFEFIHEEVGYNYRLPSLNAALGLAQIKKIEEYLTLKKYIHQKYKETLESFDDIVFLDNSSNTKSNCWVTNIILGNSLKDERDEILNSLYEKGIYCRRLWRPSHLLPMYSKCPRMDDLSITEDLYDRVVSLPSSISLARNVFTSQSHLKKAHS